MEKEISESLKNVKNLISPADETWLKSLDPEDRLAGMAFVNYKRALGNQWQTKSRPTLFMEAFSLGMDYQERMVIAAVAEDAAKAKALDTRPKTPAE